MFTGCVHGSLGEQQTQTGRAHPDVAAEYADLKVRFAGAHGADPNDRDASRLGKSEFVQRIAAAGLRGRPNA